MRENRDKRKKGIDTSIYKFIYKENPLYQFILNIVYLQYQFSLLYMNSSPRKFLYYINICSQPGGDDAAAPGEAQIPGSLSPIRTQQRPLTVMHLVKLIQDAQIQLP